MKNKIMSASQVPNYESNNLYELDSLRRQFIDNLYDGSLNDFQKATYQKALNMIEEEMLNTSACNLIQNGELDEATYEIKYAQIHNEKTASFKIEEYNDLEIIISMYELTLRKISTGATDEYRLKKIGFYNNLEIEILREFSCNEYFKPRVFCSMSLRKEKPRIQSVRNAIQDIKNFLKERFPNMPNTSIEWDSSIKGYYTPIKVTFKDGEEKRLVLEESMRNKNLFTYGQEFDENRYDSSYVDNYEVFEE